MGLAAASFTNALSLQNEVCLAAGEYFPINEVKKDVVTLTYPVKGQGLKDLFKINVYRLITKDIRCFHPDAIVFYSSHLHNIYLLLWSRRCGFKTSFVFHDPAERAEYTVMSKQYLFNRGMQIHNNIMVKFADKVITTYKDATSLVKTKYGINSNKVANIPLIPLTELATWKHFNLYSDDKKFEIVFYGRIDKYKDYATFFKALDIIQQKGIHCSALVIVQGDATLLEQYCSARLRERITIINDFLKEEDFEELVSSAKIAVFPYSGATGSHGPSVAFSLGLPVVATNVGCFDEYINDFGVGMCVDPGNPFALADAIKQILETPTSREVIHQKFLAGSITAKNRLYEVINQL